MLRSGRDTDRKKRNIKNNTEEEWEEVVHIYRENKRNREERRESFRFGCLLQLWTVEVLALHWSAHSQDLCLGDTSSSDQQEEPQGDLTLTGNVLLGNLWNFQNSFHKKYLWMVASAIS